MRRDPLTHGLAVLDKKCLGCHVLGGKGNGEQTACDLKDFGSRAWVRGLLENPQAAAYYGKVPKCDGMAEWKKSSKLKGKELDDVADFVASFAKISADMTPDEWLNSPGVAKHPGSEPFQKECGQCHKIEGLHRGGHARRARALRLGVSPVDHPDDPQAGAPDLYGYFEGKEQMPPFGPEQLTDNDVDMVIRFLRNDYPMPDRPAGTVGPGSLAAESAASGSGE